jgi:hypothetical protein
MPVADDPDATKPRKAVGYGSPPVEHQIKRGERRNPNGRRGKGNPTPAKTNTPSLAAIIREEMSRTVAQNDGTEIELHRRIVQAAILKAANGDMPAARLVIAELRRLQEREENEISEVRQLALEYRYHGQDIFDDYRRRGLEPPDIVPHPSHIIIKGDEVSINGPINHEGQTAWEKFKRCIALLTDDLAWARKHVREYPGEEWAEKSLQSALRLRRKAMRMVPKGWNWREKIWSRASVAEDRAYDAMIRDFEKKYGKVECEQVEA